MTRRGPLATIDAIGLAEAILGLDGFGVLGVEETACEVIIRVETSGGLVGCPGCGSVAVVHGRMVVEFRGSAGVRPARTVGVAQAPVPVSGVVV